MGLRTLINRKAGALLSLTGGAIARITHDRIRTYGIELDVSDPLIPGETKAALFWGFHEGAERRAAMRFLRRELAVIEVGASIGFLSALIARHIRPVAQIAVEANPKLIPILRKNLELNSAGSVEIVAAAIAYGSDAVRFEAVRDPGSGRLADSRSPAGGVEVVTTTLEPLLARLGDGPFALVCDIEGSEFELFTHESPAVRDRCQLAVMELHEVVREGVRYDRAALARHLAKLWAMKILFEDGKVCVLGR